MQEYKSKLKIGITGAGLFADCFIPLFQAHPLVGEVVLADVNPEHLEKLAGKYDIKTTYTSHDSLCCSDVDAIAIITQRHLHSPQTLEALNAGKHVFCAVPMANELKEIEAIVKKVTEKHLVYMTAETSYYYPGTIYCRNRFSRGDFGRFVYGEAQYVHDMSHGFYGAYQHSGGENWKQFAGFPPMLYPTHSVSMLLSVTGARATNVSCLGYVDEHDDGIFKVSQNLWDNVFSNETALLRTSDGGMCRINEFRRAGWIGINTSSVYASIFGTAGSFEQNAYNSAWTALDRKDAQDLTAMLACKSVESSDAEKGLNEILKQDFYQGVSEVHPVHRLPREFAGLKNGHSGSHQFLVDDFVKAVVSDQLPPNHVWAAARYCAPGLVAHESALHGGTMMEIPDFGDQPEAWGLLEG